MRPPRKEPSVGYQPLRLEFWFSEQTCIVNRSELALSR